MSTEYKISGVIEGSDGSKSEFLMIAGLGGGAWSQWGDVTTEQKADRAEYLDAMSTGLADNSNYYRQEQHDTVAVIRRMKELQDKARTWITLHGTMIYDDRDDQIKDVMKELELTDERDADVVLELVEKFAQVFVEFDMGDAFTPEELAAAE